VYLGSEYLEVSGSVIYHSFHYLCHFFSFYMYMSFYFCCAWNILFVFFVGLFLVSLSHIWNIPFHGYSPFIINIYSVKRRHHICTTCFSFSISLLWRHHICTFHLYLLSLCHDVMYIRSSQVILPWRHVSFFDILSSSLTSYDLPLRHLSFHYVIWVLLVWSCESCSTSIYSCSFVQ